MEKLIPYSKLSKKKKRERDALARTSWDVCPVTKRKNSKKTYNRKRLSHNDPFGQHGGESFFYAI